jgi:hypothetical protein
MYIMSGRQQKCPAAVEDWLVGQFVQIGADKRRQLAPQIMLLIEGDV